MTWATKSEHGEPVKLLERQLYTGPIRLSCEIELLKGVKNAA
ncbi:hypothetical protein ACOTCA_16630 [Achromobacter xylosoxidans]|nr:hypothetical protein [Achromobacter xylosoxidans]